MLLESRPKKLPVVLLNISGFLMLIGNILAWTFSSMGDTFGDPEMLQSQAQAAGRISILVWTSFAYLLLCLAVIDFWNAGKPWARQAILALLGIHLVGFIFILILFPNILFEPAALLLCFPGCWLVSLGLDIAVFSQVVGTNIIRSNP